MEKFFGRSTKIFIGLLVLAFTPWAVAGVVLEDVKTGGLGCKMESIFGSITDEGAVIYFNDFSLEAESSSPSILRTNCTLAIPVKVPANKRIVFDAIALKGVTYLGAITKGTVKLDAFFSGQTSSGQLVQEVGQAGIDFISLGDQLAQTTSCGDDVILRVNASAIMHPDDEYNLLYISRLRLKYHTEDCL